MNWEKTELIGENLPELEMLGFGAIEQAFWIKCEHCVERHQVDPAAREICEEMMTEWAAEREQWEAVLTMEGTTVEGSEVATPAEVEVVEVVEDGGKKRRRKSAVSTPRPVKKAKAAVKKAVGTPKVQPVGPDAVQGLVEVPASGEVPVIELE